MRTLKAALDGCAVEDTRAEVRAIVSELYAWLHSRRYAIKLLERSALDWPELEDMFYKQGRRKLIQHLTDYLELRIGQGRLRTMPDTPTAARLILETAAWFAVHRYGDRDSAMIDDDMAQTTVVHVLENAFVP